MVSVVFLAVCFTVLGLQCSQSAPSASRDRPPYHKSLICARRKPTLESEMTGAPTQRSPFTYEHYKHILRSALENGYKFISFLELKDVHQKEQLVCCLRHDCDNDLTAAAAMAVLEAQIGVQSTYFLMLRSAMYNLLSTPNVGLVREIIRRGHMIGLHFDEQCYPNTSPAEVASYVDCERALLSREFGLPVNVVSFHQPSQRVLDNEIRISCINTYDHSDMEGVHYLSDSNTLWRGACPSKLFHERRYPRLQLLIHPEWWTKQEMTLQQKWNQMLRNNFELVQQSLLRRERTYNQRQEIAFIMQRCNETTDSHSSGNTH